MNNAELIKSMTEYKDFKDRLLNNSFILVKKRGFEYE